MTALENSIADSMEESMQPYISSDEYQLPKAAINQKIVEFRNSLTEAQQKEFNLLMNMAMAPRRTSPTAVYSIRLTAARPLMERTRSMLPIHRVRQVPHRPRSPSRSRRSPSRP